MVNRYSLRERVYIYNTYIKNGKSCAITRRKFRRKFPGRPVICKNTLLRLIKRFSQTGSLNDRKRNQKRRVLTQGKLNEIGEALEHSPRMCLRLLAQQTGVCKATAGVATKLLKLKPYHKSKLFPTDSAEELITLPGIDVPNTPNKKKVDDLGCDETPSKKHKTEETKDKLLNGNGDNDKTEYITLGENGSPPKNNDKNCNSSWGFLEETRSPDNSVLIIDTDTDCNSNNEETKEK